jgi:hypothetical protein
MPPGPPQRSHRLIILILLAAGFAYWLIVFGLDSVHKRLLLAILAAFVAAFLPSICRRVWRLIERLNAALAPHPARTAVIVSVVVAAYLLCYAWAVRDTLFIKFNDEHAYIIQAHMLARGRLWMPAYPPDVVPFFDALSLISDRVYAAMYFPGTALASVPLVWLGLPYWLMPLLSASIAAGLLYLLAAELFDPVRALLAVLMALSQSLYRDVATYLLAEMPFLVAELVLLLAWFRFRRQQQMRWTLLVGAAAGYCAITRPLDALCISLPVGIAIIAQMWRRSKPLLGATAAIILGASPFIALLVVQNKGVTGHWLQLAESYYNDHLFPASPLGFHQVIPAQIPSNLSVPKQQWLNEWVLPMYHLHTPSNALLSWYRGRLRITLENSLPDPFLVILMPLALLSLREARRMALMAALILFFIGYATYLFFLNHYIIAVFPSIICMILMASETVRRAWLRTSRPYIFILFCIFTISITTLWPVKSLPAVAPGTAADQRPANALLAQLSQTPAVVLFRFDPKVTSAHDDPVYNDTVAFPDDAPVIRARDLGPEQDRAIYRYYAQRQPNRVFYIYDPRARSEGKNPIIGPIGTAAELTEKVPSTGTPQPPG